MIDILIPTLGRHRALQPLAANMLNTTPEGGYRVVFVADRVDTDTRNALAEICVFHPAFGCVIQDGTYPVKINAAYRASDGDLVLPTADDVVFHDGWLEAATNALSDESVQVLGTDDLSPSTANRDHATMPILRRSYIEDPGAVWHERGSVFYEGYRHNYCETETWSLATHRGVTGWAEDCVIEHLHPDWGKREIDDTDRKGNRDGSDADRVLFGRRQHQWSRS